MAHPIWLAAIASMRSSVPSLQACASDVAALSNVRVRNSESVALQQSGPRPGNVARADHDHYAWREQSASIDDYSTSPTPYLTVQPNWLYSPTWRGSPLLRR